MASLDESSKFGAFYAGRCAVEFRDTAIHSSCEFQFHLLITQTLTHSYRTMPFVRDFPMNDTSDTNDAIINRINLQLARSRSILNSWQSQSAKADENQEDDLRDNDEEFTQYDEKGGIGSKASHDDESSLLTRRSAFKDKLLEQLIGKKAASAKRKEDAHKSMSTSKHAAPKPLTNGQMSQAQAEESDEEEEGRAAAFRSKKSSNLQAQTRANEEAADDADEEGQSESMHAIQGLEAAEGKARENSDAKAEPKAPKRKAGGSYLDELLSKKAKKKSKKK